MGCLVECMARYVGQTVTIFTTSGGLSGSGFTGVLICVDDQVARLLCDMGAPPACPLGSACTGPIGIGAGIGPGVGCGCGCGGGCGGGCGCGRGCCGGGCGCGRGIGVGVQTGAFPSACGCVNPLGSVINIPICAIAAFNHCAI